MALMQFEAEERKMRLEQRIEEGFACVLGDETQISQVLVNIVVNAFHAMPNGGLCRIVARERTTDNGRWAEIAVKRYRRRHPKEDDVPAIRTILYDQVEWNWARPRDCVSNHAGSRRNDQVSSVPRSGTTVVLSFPAACETASADDGRLDDATARIS